MSGSGISWAICKSAPRPRQTTMPAPHHSVFTGRMPFLPPNQQRQSTVGNFNMVDSKYKELQKQWSFFFIPSFSCICCITNIALISSLFLWSESKLHVISCYIIPYPSLKYTVSLCTSLHAPRTSLLCRSHILLGLLSF